MLWFATLAWFGLLALVLWRSLRCLDGFSEILADRRVVGALAFCAALFAAGITWGWPGPGWPPDEIAPRFALDAWQRRFTGGWYDRYPPVFYYLSTIAQAPILAIASLDRVNLTDGPGHDLLYLSSRLLSLLLSLGTLASVGVLCARLGYRREAWLAVLLTGTFLPTAFYAKTANVDAAYVFWFALSLVFFARTGAAAPVTSFLGLGATAAMAVATKDQAYSLYVLPGLYLLWRAARGGPDAPKPASLVAAATTGIAVWAIAQNLLFNVSGFQEHIRMILGPASTDYRLFEANLAGQTQLFMATGLQIWQCLSWAGGVAMALGVAATASAKRPLPPWLWLTIPSSYISFTAIVGYSYDRFLLPPMLVCAVAAAVGIAALLQAPAPSHWKRAGGVILLAWIVMRPIGLDVLMVTDARYEAERWLHRTVRAHERVGTFGQLVTLPRLGAFNHVTIRPGIAETMQVSPDFIVVNVEYMERFGADPVRMAWLAWLQSGTGPYREVFRYKSPVPWYSPLRLDARFTDRVEDPFTNLDKVNPEIAIFRRQ